jgi:hypothetical protein
LPNMTATVMFKRRSNVWMEAENGAMWYDGKLRGMHWQMFSTSI